MAPNLHTYETQARLSVYLAALGAAAAVGTAGMIIRNFDRAAFYVTYNAKGPWLLVVGIGLMIGLGAATAGFFMGLNSAGQKRNKLSSLAWKGFFLNAAVLMVLLGAAVFLYFTRNPITIKTEMG